MRLEPGHPAPPDPSAEVAGKDERPSSAALRKLKDGPKTGLLIANKSYHILT
jgi:hypothetical protein